MIKVSAPGKLMFSGEWSVLERGNPAIVFALDKKVNIRIENNKEIVLNAPDFEINSVKCFFDGKQLQVSELTEKQKKDIRFLHKSVEVSLHFLKEKKIKLKGFKVSTDSSEMQREKVKVGFGSSAALCTAVVYGVCLFHGLRLKEMQVFKLATIAHFLSQEKIGSGFDVAASSFGGVVLYKRFDGKFVEKVSKKSLVKAVNRDWPGLYIKEVGWPKNLKFLVVFSGKKADTRELVNKMNEFRVREIEVYERLMKELSYITDGLKVAFSKNNEKKIVELVKENREKLKELGVVSKTNLETNELSEIIETANELGLAAKFCGAGGGDSAIIVCFDEKKKKLARKALNEKGFTIIDAEISFDGVKNA